MKHAARLLRSILLMAGALILASCASPDTPEKLAAAGRAYTPSAEGTIETDAVPSGIGGGAAWTIKCEQGWEFTPCEARARNLCPRGYIEIARKAEKPANSAGIQMMTAPSGDGESVVGFRSFGGAMVRTLVVKCK